MQPKPLAGIRVLEFGGYISGPYVTSLLCSLGADVIKVERPGSGDEFRHGEDDANIYFRQYNTGKRSLAVDLKSPEGVSLVKSLVAETDVVLENLRPGKMDALGLGRDDLTALRPDLVYTSVTGFGSSGDWAARPGFDQVGQAFGGLTHTLSDDGASRLTGTCLADLVTGLSTVAGILAALAGRDRGGQGTHLETSLVEAVSTLTADAITQLHDNGHSPTRQSRHPQGQNFCLKTASNDYIVLHLSSSQKFWESLVTTINRPELLTDPRFTTFNDRAHHYFDLARILDGEFMLHTATEWQHRLITHDVPFAPVNSIEDYRNHPQVQALQIFQTDPTTGASLTRAPWRYNGQRPTREGHTPRVGEHTLDIATPHLTPTQLHHLIHTGVLYTSTPR